MAAVLSDRDVWIRQVSAKSPGLCPLIRQGAVCHLLVFDEALSDFRGRGSRVQQVGGDAARQGRALQGAQVSLSALKGINISCCRNATVAKMLRTP